MAPDLKYNQRAFRVIIFGQLVFYVFWKVFTNRNVIVVDVADFVGSKFTYDVFEILYDGVAIGVAMQLLSVYHTVSGILINIYIKTSSSWTLIIS